MAEQRILATHSGPQMGGGIGREKNAGLETCVRMDGVSDELDGITNAKRQELTRQLFD